MNIHQVWIDIDGVTPPQKELEYQKKMIQCCEEAGVNYHFWDMKSGVLDIIRSYGIDSFLPMPPVTLSDLARWCIIDTFSKKGEGNLYMDMDTEPLPEGFARAYCQLECFPEKTYLAHEDINTPLLDHCAIFQSGETSIPFEVVCWIIEKLLSRPEKERGPMTIAHPLLLTPFLQSLKDGVEHIPPQIVYPWNFRACSYAPWGEDRVRKESAFIHQFRGNWSWLKHERDKKR